MVISIIIGIFLASLLLYYREYKKDNKLKYGDFLRFRNRRNPKTTNIINDLPTLLLLTNAVLITITYAKTHWLITIFLGLLIIWAQKTVIYACLKMRTVITHSHTI